MKFKLIFAIILVNMVLIGSIAFVLIRQNQADVVSEIAETNIVSEPAQAGVMKELSQTDMVTKPFVNDLPQYQNISLYGVILDDGGAKGPVIGCGDSLVPMRNYDSEQYRNVEEGLVMEAIRELLAFSNKNLENELNKISFYTAAYQPNLKVEEVLFDDNVVDVFLSGNLTFGGVCDVPRFEEQLEATAIQFEGIDSARFYLNGSEGNFRRALSGQ